MSQDRIIHGNIILVPVGNHKETFNWKLQEEWGTHKGAETAKIEVRTLGNYIDNNGEEEYGISVSESLSKIVPNTVKDITDYMETLLSHNEVDHVLIKVKGRTEEYTSTNGFFRKHGEKFEEVHEFESGEWDTPFLTYYE